MARGGSDHPVEHGRRQDRPPSGDASTASTSSSVGCLSRGTRGHRAVAHRARGRPLRRSSGRRPQIGPSGHALGRLEPVAAGHADVHEYEVGACRAMTSPASTPSTASPTRSTSSWPPRMRRSPDRTRASSSTTTTRTGPAESSVPWQLGLDDELVPHGARPELTVHQPRAFVEPRQAVAGPRPRRPCRCGVGDAMRTASRRADVDRHADRLSGAVPPGIREGLLHHSVRVASDRVGTSTCAPASVGRRSRSGPCGPGLVDQGIEIEQRRLRRSGDGDLGPRRRLGSRSIPRTSRSSVRAEWASARTTPAASTVSSVLRSRPRYSRAPACRATRESRCPRTSCISRARWRRSPSRTCSSRSACSRSTSRARLGARRRGLVATRSRRRPGRGGRSRPRRPRRTRRSTRRRSRPRSSGTRGLRAPTVAATIRAADHDLRGVASSRGTRGQECGPERGSRNRPGRRREGDREGPGGGTGPGREPRTASEVAHMLRPTRASLQPEMSVESQTTAKAAIPSSERRRDATTPPRADGPGTVSGHPPPPRRRRSRASRSRVVRWLCSWVELRKRPAGGDRPMVGDHGMRRPARGAATRARTRPARTQPARTQPARTQPARGQSVVR